jgi:hypothetical protein
MFVRWERRKISGFGIRNVSVVTGSPPLTFHLNDQLQAAKTNNHTKQRFQYFCGDVSNHSTDMQIVQCQGTV